jgi:uncharacterized protein (TIGR04141 family)
MLSRIAICLFEEFIDSFDLYKLMGGQPLEKVALHKLDDEAALFLKSSNESTPEWVELVKKFAHLDVEKTVTASSGAILLLKIKNRIIACCFGSSVGNINRDNIVVDFGLAVAYNRIPKTNYKAIETHTLSEIPITNNRSAAVPSSQGTFNMDTYLETITELSGKYQSETRRVLIKGKQFFSVPSPLSLAHIKELCTNLIDEYAVTVTDPDYKKLTAVSKVQVKKLIEFLNDKLCDYLNARSPLVHLHDYSQRDELETYSITPKGPKLTDIEMDDIYKDLKKGQKFTMDYLRTRRIAIYEADGQFLEEWPLYKCLFTEVALQFGGHILYKGHWYEVQKRYLDDLKAFIAGYEVDPKTLELPKWDGIQPEGDYNTAAAFPADAQCWDKILYSHPDFSYGIEFCDLLQPGHVMHVKKLASSSLNSHLLMQTYVSAQLLKSDSGIRQWILSKSKKKFRKNIFLKPSHEYKQPPVSYVIVLMGSGKKKPLAEVLPFFSLITFNMVIRRITQLDFPMKVCLV